MIVRTFDEHEKRRRFLYRHDSFRVKLLSHAHYFLILHQVILAGLGWTSLTDPSARVPHRGDSLLDPRDWELDLNRRSGMSIASAYSGLSLRPCLDLCTLCIAVPITICTEEGGEEEGRMEGSRQRDEHRCGGRAYISSIINQHHYCATIYSQ